MSKIIFITCLGTFPQELKQQSVIFVLSTACIKNLCLNENIYVVKFNVMTHWWIASQSAFFINEIFSTFPVPWCDTFVILLHLGALGGLQGVKIQVVLPITPFFPGVMQDLP